jgi:hypothetical protein
LGVPKVAAFESRAIGAWREYLPSFDQWMIACACVFGAAAIGFIVGRSSAPATMPAMTDMAQRTVCPDPTHHPSLASQPTGVRDLAPTTEARIEAPSPSAENPSPSPEPSAAPDPAAQQATEKAIGRAMSRGSRRAASCRGATSPTGTAHVTVTFLPTGEVKTATVRGTPFAGTAEGECIVGKFRPLRVPAFTGDNVTVKKDLTLE